MRNVFYGVPLLELCFYAFSDSRAENEAMRKSGTALITGASGGIGEALAQQIAAAGFRIILAARSQEKLQALGERLSREHGVEHRVIVADLSRSETTSAIEAAVHAYGWDIDLLVNNAGFTVFGPFADVSWRKQHELLEVNIVTLTALTHRFLPGMLARQNGGILNVASTAAFMPGPLMAVYYASKAYVLSFSEALHEEVAGSGVTVTALCPGPTETGFQSRGEMEDSKLVRDKRLMSADAVARAGLKGLFAGKRVVVPGMMNKLSIELPRFLPRAMMPGIVKRAQAPSEKHDG